MNRRTEDEIAGEMIADLVLNTRLTNWRPLGVADQIVRAIARQIAQVEERIWRLRDSRFLATAPEEDLDALALEYTGTGRRGPTKARGGALVFLREETGQPLTVAAGTLVARTADGFQYSTLHETRFASTAKESLPVVLLALRPGILGNAETGTIRTLPVAVPGVVGCENREPVTGGSDAETASEMIERVRAYRAALKPNTGKGIIAAALETVDEHGTPVAYAQFDTPIPSPRQVLYVSDAAGTCDITDLAPAPEVLIHKALGTERFTWLTHWPLYERSLFTIVAARNPATGALKYLRCSVEPARGLLILHTTPPAGWRVETTTPYRYYTGLVRAVQARIDGRDGSLGVCPPGVTVRVLPAVRRWVTIAAVLSPRSVADQPTIEQDLQRTLPPKLNRGGMGAPLTVAKVIDAIMDHPLVRNVRDVRLDARQEDITATAGEILRVRADDFAWTWEHSQ